MKGVLDATQILEQFWLRKIWIGLMKKQVRVCLDAINALPREKKVKIFLLPADQIFNILSQEPLQN